MNTLEDCAPVYINIARSSKQTDEDCVEAAREAFVMVMFVEVLLLSL